MKMIARRISTFKLTENFVYFKIMICENVIELVTLRFQFDAHELRLHQQRMHGDIQIAIRHETCNFDAEHHFLRRVLDDILLSIHLLL